MSVVPVLAARHASSLAEPVTLCTGDHRARSSRGALTFGAILGGGGPHSSRGHRIGGRAGRDPVVDLHRDFWVCPLALTFARLARRSPDAGGVAAFRRAAAFGDAAGAVSGWWFFIAGSVGQAIVPSYRRLLRVCRAWLGAGLATLRDRCRDPCNRISSERGRPATSERECNSRSLLAVGAVLVVAIATLQFRTRVQSNLHPFFPHGNRSSHKPPGSPLFLLRPSPAGK